MKIIDQWNHAETLKKIKNETEDIWCLPYHQETQRSDKCLKQSTFPMVNTRVKNTRSNHKISDNQIVGHSIVDVE